MPAELLPTQKKEKPGMLFFTRAPAIVDLIDRKGCRCSSWMMTPVVPKRKRDRSWLRRPLRSDSNNKNGRKPCTGSPPHVVNRQKIVGSEIQLATNLNWRRHRDCNMISVPSKGPLGCSSRGRRRPNGLSATHHAPTRCKRAASHSTQAAYPRLFTPRLTWLTRSNSVNGKIPRSRRKCKCWPLLTEEKP